MKKELTIFNKENIKSKIYTIRGLKVILDRDLAEIYGVKNKALNQAVKRNIDRFPEDFMFKLTNNEFNVLKSQFVTSSWGGIRKLPYAFTEQGIAMLSGVLNSEIAINVSIQIMRTFIEMRKFIASNSHLFQKIHSVERKQLSYEIKTDKQFKQIFNAIEDNEIVPKQGIFYDGQVFDAYKFVYNIIKKANYSIIIIDNYVDDSVLTMLDNRKKDVEATIFTKNISNKLSLILKKHNSQYSPIRIKEFKNSHDRFIIIDNKEVYHLGASLKDLGKKIFAFSKLNKDALKILNKLEKD